MISAVLFDKDGTLLDFDKSWEPVNRKLAHFAAGGDRELADRLLRLCGMDPETGKVEPDSLFAAAASSEIAAALAEGGAIYGVEELTPHVDRFFLEGAADAVALADLKAIFLRLKERGLKLGIASSDNEASIRKMAEGQHILPLLDFIAGYDSGHGVKPTPGMIEAFARATDLPVSAIAMVGDNTHDLHMARNAKAGLAVAVLTGTGTRETLTPTADHVIASIEELETLLSGLSA